jgi:hypothetical protein
MRNHYDRKWEIIEEVDLDLFDGNRVRVQWLEREALEETTPAQIRIHSTAGTNPRRLKRMTSLANGHHYGPGWEPIIMETLQQVSERLREADLDTCDVFLATLFGCFKKHWGELPDGPLVHHDSALNAVYAAEAIDTAVAYFLAAPHDDDLEENNLLDWGEQDDSEATAGDEDID